MDLSYSIDPHTLREVPSNLADIAQRIEQLWPKALENSAELIGLLRISGRLDEAQKLGEEALAEKWVNPEDLGSAELLPASATAMAIRYAHVRQWQGELDFAATVFDQALASAKASRMQSPVMIAFALQHRGKCSYDRGRFAEALADFDEAHSIRQMIGAPIDQIQSSQVAMQAAQTRLDQPTFIALPEV